MGETPVNDQSTPDGNRVQIQIWPNHDHGYTGYLPQYDIQVNADTFDGARGKALEAARNTTRSDTEGAPDMKIDPAPPRWTCVCGQDNPPGRTGCSSCGSPQL